MSRNIALKRHYRHDPSKQAAKGVTARVTGDGSMRHPSPHPSPIKPLDHADRDTCDALEHKPGPIHRETSKMGKQFTSMKARNYEFRDGENTRDLIAIYAGATRIGFVEYSAARQFSDLLHDLCDAHETTEREKNHQTLEELEETE